MYLPSIQVTRSIFAMISAGTEKTTEVIMEPIGPYEGRLKDEFRIPSRSFDAHHRYTPQVSTFMANLKKLRLAVEDKHSGQPYLPKDKMAKVLAQASNLEYLFLETCSENSKGIFRLTLGGCQFPHLRVLVLKDTGMDGADLLSFFKDAAKLKHLVLEDCMVELSLAEQFLATIKACTQLETLYLDCCFWANRYFDCVHYPQCRCLHYADHYYDRDVERFVFGNGPNPFSMEAIHNGKHQPRAPSSITRTAEKYYKMFFC